MSAHTPGPWQVKREGVVSDRDGKVVATLGFNVSVGSTEDGDNARLIAAAPDLLAACEAAVEELRGDENYVGDNGAEAEFLVNLRAAIAKARVE